MNSTEKFVVQVKATDVRSPITWIDYDWDLSREQADQRKKDAEEKNAQDVFRIVPSK